MPLARWFYALRLQVRSLFQSGRVEQELNEELQYHVQQEMRERVARGVPPEEARRQALIRLGGIETAKEHCRDRRPTRWLEDVAKDSRLALRSFGRNPGFALVCVVILALGIGANTAIFSVLNTLLLQPLPYRDSDRVVFTLGWDLRDDTMRFNVAAADWIEWRSTVESFEEVSAYRFLPVNLTGVDQPARLQGYRVTPNVFSLLGVEPVLGRVFRADEGTPGGAEVVVLSHALWQERFGSDPSVIGQVLRLNDTAFRVVGVMPRRFEFPQFNFKGDLWMPLRVDVAALQTDRRASFSMVSVARLRPTVSLTQAQAELDAIYRRLEDRYPDSNAGLGVRVIPIQGLLAEQLLSPLALLLGTVGVVLLIVCANVASLLLARAKVRAREMAIRSALGAGRHRLVRQLVTEGLVLATLGGSLGVLLSLWGLGALRAAIPEFVADIVPAVRHIGIDVPVLVFSASVSILATLVFGLVPAVMLSRTTPMTNLRTSGGEAGGWHRHRLLSGLVVGEVALSAVLLVGAGLTTRSLWNVMRVDPGFDPTGLLVVDLTMPTTRYPDTTRRAAFVEQVLERVASLPGVEAAGVVNTLPLSTSNSSTRVTVEGEPPPTPGETPRADFRVVSPDYFGAMKIPLRGGRGFDSRDHETAPPVAVVNDTFARRFFAGRETLGHRLTLGRQGSEAPALEIVGVVGDVKHWDLTWQPNPEVYVPFRQSAGQSTTLAVRAPPSARGLADSIQREIRAVDPDQPADNAQLMEQLVGRSMLVRRLSAVSVAGFAGVALLLATVGLYGVISYTATQRVPELAIRMALGAQSRDVIGLVLRRGFLLAFIGVGLGLAMAFGLARLVASLLFGLTPTDPITFLGVAGLLVIAALAACGLPARRASRTDPVVALRCE